MPPRLRRLRPGESAAAILNSGQPNSDGAIHRPGVKSFARRGRITAAQRRGWENFWKQYGVECADSPPDWNAIFGRDAPLFLEIGGGGGEGAAALAEANPQNNYVAMEVYAPGVGALLNKLAAMQLQNARAACADAATSLEKMFADGSLCGAHIFFPDPWPKKKHHKRRLLNAAFADLLAKKIIVGGFVQMATDWRNYAEQIEEGFGAHPHFVAATAAEANCPPRPPTRFAARAAKENRPPADLIYLRR